MTEQVIRVFDDHIKLYSKLNEIKKADNAKDERSIRRNKEMLQRFEMWLDAARAHPDAPQA